MYSPSATRCRPRQATAELRDCQGKYDLIAFVYNCNSLAFSTYMVSGHIEKRRDSGAPEAWPPQPGRRGCRGGLLQNSHTPEAGELVPAPRRVMASTKVLMRSTKSLVRSTKLLVRSTKLLVVPPKLLSKPPKLLVPPPKLLVLPPKLLVLPPKL